MRIGITGSQGVGKSTLAKELAKALDLPVICEQARRVASELGIKSIDDVKRNIRLGTTFQWYCLIYQLSEERRYPAFVSDRTTIDNAVYWMRNFAHLHPAGTNELYYSVAMANVKSYDLIVYVPPEIPPEDDGFRDTDIAFQREIDFYIRALLALASPANLITAEGSVEQRVYKALRTVESLQKGDKGGEIAAR